MISPFLVAMSACRRDPGDPDHEPTADSGDGDSGAPTVVGRCVAEQDVSSGILASAWRSPSGTLFAVGASAQARVRAPDGAWTLDPAAAPAYQVHGSSDDEVWALGYGGVTRRQADGTWLDMGAPVPRWEGAELHVFGPDDALVVRVEDLTCTDCYTRQRPYLVSWDGASWTEQALPIVDGPVFAAAVLPDRTVVLAADGGLAEVGGGAVSTPPGAYVRDVYATDDGTLIALAEGSVVAIGTVDGGLVENDPPQHVDEWSHAWGTSAADVWVSGEWWEGGTVPWAVVAHWDGLAWTGVLVDHPAGTLALAGGGGQAFAVGGYDHEIALVGDAAGLAVDREAFGVGELQGFAIDDVTGEVWAGGYGPTLGRFDGTGWEGVPLPDRSVEAERLAASDGRLVIVDQERLLVFEGGALSSTPVPGWYWAPVAAADGALFATSAPSGGEGPNLPIEVWREAGAGWESLDTTGLPSGSEPICAWADGADDLWLGLEGQGGGALARWDGAAWTVPLAGLAEAPGSLTRGEDGRLYFTQFERAAQGDETLWTWDGATAAPVADVPPDVRDADVLADGTLVVSVIAEAATSDEDLYGRLLARAPGADWVELGTADGVVPFVASADTVWSGDGTTAWWWAPCAPSAR